MDDFAKVAEAEEAIAGYYRLDDLLSAALAGRDHLHGVLAATAWTTTKGLESQGEDAELPGR